MLKCFYFPSNFKKEGGCSNHREKVCESVPDMKKTQLESQSNLKSTSQSKSSSPSQHKCNSTKNSSPSSNNLNNKKCWAATTKSATAQPISHFYHADKHFSKELATIDQIMTIQSSCTVDQYIINHNYVINLTIIPN